ncbi:hypothetical protein ABT263_23260 [Kitasatospora sp. NPDC001603]|uniref:hypothetical protein n=1 Tax=Kitasatospora sp. NPDC001603 TaxID=3154388 RepID=UPI00332A1EE7
MAVLDLPDVWKGWWVPPWIAGRVPARVVPGPAEIAGYGPVHSPPAMLKEHCRRGVRRSWGVETWAAIFAVLPAAAAGALALSGLILTVHPSASDNPQYTRQHTLEFFSLSAGLGSAAALTALIGPAVMWGSDKLGTRREHAQAVAAAVNAAGSAPAEPPPPVESPSAAGVPTPRA